MEPIQEKILEIQDFELRIQNLIHLARNRGGMSDLMHILSIRSEINDDQTVLSQEVINAYYQLANEYYQQLVKCKNTPYTEKFYMYKIPTEATSIAWDGENLWYLINKELVKCNGNANSAKFGLEIKRQEIAYSFKGSVSMVANKNFLFATDEEKIFTIDKTNFKILSDQNLVNKGTSKLACFNEEYLYILQEKNLYRFSIHEDLSGKLYRFRYESNDFPIYDPQKIQNFFFIASKTKYSFYADQECIDYLFDGSKMQKIKTTRLQQPITHRTCYCFDKNYIMTFSSQDQTFEIQSSSSYFNTDLETVQYQSTADQLLQQYFQSDLKHSVSLTLSQLKQNIVNLIQEWQEHELQSKQDENLLGYTVNQTLKVYDQIIKGNQPQILLNNLKQLNRQNFALADLKDQNFELDLIKALTDNFNSTQNMSYVEEISGYITYGSWHKCLDQLKSVFQTSDEEKEWQLLFEVFANKVITFCDGHSLAGDIIRLNWNQTVTRQELKDEQTLVKLLYLDTVKVVNQNDEFDGILSGGYIKTEDRKQCPKVISCLKMSQKGPLKNYGGDTAIKLTEQTFLAIVQLVGLSWDLEHAEQLIEDYESENDLLEAFQMDVDMNQVFNLLWLRACQVKVYYVNQKNTQFNSESEGTQQDQLEKFVTDLLKKCELLQKLNTPQIIQKQLKQISSVSKVQSSFENEQIAAQVGNTFKLWKQKLIKSNDELSQKLEAISKSVLKCLQSSIKVDQMQNYLDEANSKSKTQLNFFEKLIEFTNSLQDESLNDFMRLFKNFKLNNGDQFSYVIKGIDLDTQHIIQERFFTFLKVLLTRCNSEDRINTYVELFRTMKFSARDFQPLYKQLDVFNLLYTIKNSMKDVSQLVENILNRLDDEKELSVEGLRRDISRIDATASNQLLKSYVSIVFSEFQSYKQIWEKVQSSKTPITKETVENQGFQNFELRLMQQCTVEISLDDLQPLCEDEMNLNDLFGIDDESAIKKEKRVASQASLDQSKAQQIKLILAESYRQFGEKLNLMISIAKRFDRHPALLQLFVHPSELTVLLELIKITDTQVSLKIVNLLQAMCIHESNVPIEILNHCCESLTVQNSSQTNKSSTFVGQLLGVVHLQMSKEDVSQWDREKLFELKTAIIKLIQKYATLSLLDNFADLDRNYQILVLEIFGGGQQVNNNNQSSEVLRAIEQLITNQRICNFVKLMALKILILNNVQNLLSETISYLIQRSVFAELSVGPKQFEAEFEKELRKPQDQQQVQSNQNDQVAQQNQPKPNFEIQNEPTIEVSQEFLDMMDLFADPPKFSSEKPLQSTKIQVLEPQKRQLTKNLHAKRSLVKDQIQLDQFQLQVKQILQQSGIPLIDFLFLLGKQEELLNQIKNPLYHQSSIIDFAFTNYLKELTDSDDTRKEIVNCLLRYQQTPDSLEKIQQQSDSNVTKPYTISVSNDFLNNFIDICASRLLFTTNIPEPNYITLHLFSRYYFYQVENQEWLQNWLYVENKDQMYTQQLKNYNRDTTQHILKSIYLESDLQQKFRKVLFYCKSDLLKQNQTLHIKLIKQLIQLFFQQAEQKVDNIRQTLESVLKVLQSVTLETFNQLDIASYIAKLNDQNEKSLIKAHFKVLLGYKYKNATQEGKWIQFVEDVQKQNFQHIFSNYIADQNFGKEENELLKKYWSEKLVVKVSKNLNYVIVAHESQEQVAEYLIALILRVFQRICSFDETDRKLLLADQVPSKIQNLLRYANYMERYDKYEWQFDIQPQTNRSKEEITFNRHQSFEFKELGQVDQGDKDNCTLFTQIMIKVRDQVDSSFGVFRRNYSDDRVFYARYDSEGSYDSGGPYRDLFDSICAELMSPILPILVPSPNQSSEFGDLRNCWLLNPNSDNFDLFYFFGIILGYAIRSTSPLLLDLHPIVWKQICQLKLTDQDLKQSDLYRYQMLDQIRKAGSEHFEELIDQTFTLIMTDGTQIDLVKDGSKTRVTFENHQSYIKLATEQLLNVSSKQAQWVREGVDFICGRENIDNTSWIQLEERACGPATIDINYLKEHTGAEGSTSEETVERLWRVLESFEQSDRVKYLQFVSGRGKLPINMQDLEYKHTIASYYHDDQNHDEKLPISHTCFFTIDLPDYSSDEIMRKNLLIAITFCATIDGDRDVFEDEY